MPKSSDAFEAPQIFPGLLCDSSHRLIYTDGLVYPVEGRAGCSFFVPSSNYHFVARLLDASSVLFAYLYAIFRC